ncbi:MAG: OmpP1/FadL family transporter [Bradymonadia bacterium]
MRTLPTRYCLALAALLCTTTAQGNGLEIPEQGARSLARGGAFSAKADDATATIHNPGAVSKLKGTHIVYSHNLLWNYSDFTRAETSLGVSSTDALEGHANALQTSENQTPFFPLALSLATTTDFGLDNWSFGLSLVGPNSSGRVTYPQDGGQRYLLTELDVLLVHYGVTAAYGTESWGIGATLQWVQMPYLDFSLVVDASAFGNSLSPYASSFDVLARIKTSDAFSPSALLGAWYRPIPAFEIAISGRPFPIAIEARGEPSIEAIPGTIPDDLNWNLDVVDGAVGLDLELPRTARLGMRYRHLEGDTERFDLEVDVVWEGWSSLDRYDTQLDGTVTPLEGLELAINDVQIDKNWQDTLSIRFGGSYQVIDDTLLVSAGAYWEQAAAPKGYSHIDFPAGERMGAGTGFTYTLAVGEATYLDLSVAYSLTKHADINVSESEAKVYQQRPLSPCSMENMCDPPNGVSVNAGRFRTTFHQVGLALGLRL